MVITKYKIEVENGYVEFSSEAAALAYRVANNIDAVIVEVSETTEDPKPVLHELIEQKIRGAQKFGNKLILEFGRENILLGYTTSDVKSVIEKCSVVLSMLQTGSLYTAIEELDNIQPDARLTSGRLIAFANKIRAYLELPLE